MEFRETFVRWASNIVMALLLLAGVYCGVNGYLNTVGTGGNAVNMAAWSALGSFFIVLAIFLAVAQGISRMNDHLDHISSMADEQVKGMRYIARQNKTPQ